MSIPIAQLNGQVSAQLAGQTLPSIILINGNELLLVEEALDELRAQLKQHGYSERIGYQLDASFDWNLVTGHGQAMSLFSDKRIVELRVPKSLGAQGAKHLSEALDSGSDDLLIIIMPLLDRRQRQAKWYKQLDKSALIADAYDVPLEQQSQWIKQRLQSRALRVEAGVVEQLAAMTEGNLLAAAQEIEKLKVLADQGAVTLSLLNQSLADHARYNVYELCDVCLSGDFVRAKRMLARLESEGVEPVIVSWALVKDVRALAAIRFGLDSGQPFASLCQANQIWSKRQSLMQHATSRFMGDAANRLLFRASQLDRSIKGQPNAHEVGGIWFQLAKLCSLVCGYEDFELANQRIA